VKKFLFIPAMCILCASCSSNSNDKSKDHAKGHEQTQSADWEITANVKKKLMMEGSLSSGARMVSVTTNNGVVTLTGTVANHEESRKVSRLVKEVSGVKSVDNQLTVSNPNS